MIFLKAYLENNLGDDLFVSIITDRYPETRFIVVAPEVYKNIYRNKKNLKIINKNGLMYRALDRFFRKYMQSFSVERLINAFCRGSVYIGGSIFIQPPADKYEKSLKSFYHFINKRFTAVIGCDFGPYTDKRFLKDYRAAFKYANDICFRDKTSYLLFRDAENTRYAPDTVFCMPQTPQVIQKKSVFISVINLEERAGLSKYQKTYEEKIIEFINMFTAEGYDVKLATFCRAEGDEKTANNILSSNRLQLQNKVEPLYYRGNLEEIINPVKESEIVIATRFHSMILGLLFGKKTFPIVYSDKMTATLECCGLDIDYVKITEIGSLTQSRLNNILNKYTVPNLKSIIKNADKQFMVTDKFLKRS